MNFIHKVSPEQFVERVKVLIPYLPDIRKTKTEVKYTFNHTTGSHTYYCSNVTNIVSHGFTSDIGSLTPHASVAFGIEEGSELSFTYRSYKNDWLARRSIYGSIGVPIMDYEDLTEDFLFQQSLVLHEIEMYAMVVFAYAKHLDMESFAFTPAALLFYEGLCGIRH